MVFNVIYTNALLVRVVQINVLWWTSATSYLHKPAKIRAPPSMCAMSSSQTHIHREKNQSLGQ